LTEISVYLRNGSIRGQHANMLMEC